MTDVKFNPLSGAANKVPPAAPKPADRAAGANPITPRPFVPDKDLVKQMVQRMVDEVKGENEFKKVGHGDTPAIDLVPADPNVLKVKQNYLNNDDCLDWEGPAEYELARMPADGKVDVTFLAPVSGHCGLANATVWAGLDPNRKNETNTFNVKVTFPDGESYVWKGLKANNYITAVPLTLPLKKGTTCINYWADGSFGVDGYAPGRTINIKVP